ncbi:hypothetical protein ACSNN7_01800 [Micromonospora sp. URMC 105]|uniref:hypothetical protein n=1 Tax=Micromonospora sp. URMC 105 TaxID=3423413 RepID=UPI003F1DC7FB
MSRSRHALPGSAGTIAPVRKDVRRHAAVPLDLTEAFIQLGTTRYDETSLDAVLTRIAEVAHDGIPVAAEVSVTLVHGAEATTAAYTGELALRLDEFQYEQGGGPCLDAATTGPLMIVADMAVESRWPEWARRTHAAGVPGLDVGRRTVPDRARRPCVRGGGGDLAPGRRGTSHPTRRAEAPSPDSAGFRRDGRCPPGRVESGRAR